MNNCLFGMMCESPSVFKVEDNTPVRLNQSAVKSVIFTADDFGARPETNHAVIRAHREGVLTSASLMVNEAGASEALDLARANPGLAVGLHLVLSDGLAALPADRIPHLVGATRRFRSNPAVAGIRYFFGRAARREVKSEMAAQFDRFAAAGLDWSHVDGHQHLHLHPVVWDEMVRLSEAHGVRSVRIPNEEFLPPQGSNRGLCLVEWLMFGALRRRCLRRIRGKGFTVADRVYGHLATGEISVSYLVGLLGRLKGQTNEVYLHPGTRDSSEDAELQALISPAVRRRIDDLELCLATYAGISG